MPADTAVGTFSINTLKGSTFQTKLLIYNKYALLYGVGNFLNFLFAFSKGLYYSMHALNLKFEFQVE